MNSEKRIIKQYEYRNSLTDETKQYVAEKMMEVDLDNLFEKTHQNG
jgi:hypothetical protein